MDIKKTDYCISPCEKRKYDFNLPGNILWNWCIENNREYILDEIFPHEQSEEIAKKITYGSNKRLSFSCKYGHIFQQQLKVKTNAYRGCPICDKGRNTSFPEQAILFYIKKIFPDVESRKTIDGKEVDIYIPSENLGIEYNGYHWHKELDDKQYEDHKKVERLRQKGVKMLIINEIIGKEASLHCNGNRIDFIIKNATNYPKLLPSLLENVFICLTAMLGKKIETPLIDVKNDAPKIYENVGRTCCVENSLTGKNNKDINKKLKYWDYKNNKITPDMLSPHSSTIVYWLCSNCGKSFPRAVKVIIGSGVKNVCCQECGEKLWAHKTTEVINLTTGELFPSIREASLKYAKDRKTGKPSLNGAITSACTNKTIRYGCRWMYAKDYEKIIGKQYNPPSSSAVKLDPELLKYWDYDKNLPEIPANLTKNTHYWLIEGNTIKCSIKSLQKRLKKLTS